MEYKTEFTILLPEKLTAALDIDEDTLFETYFDDGKIKVRVIDESEFEDELSNCDLTDTICMTRSNKNAITDFKKSKNGILFASGSMWEGVDCVGDCLSSVIIVRLPFPMRSALMEEKKNNCDSVGDFVDRYCTPNMLIKLRQGVGRLIRCESDTGVVSILDPRAISKSYSGKIGQALHKFPKVDSAQEIESFMRGVKDEEYYGEKKENRK